MDLFAAYETDETKEVEGVWVTIGDAKFLVARSGNREHAKLLGRLIEKNQKALDRKDEAADKLSEQLIIEAMAKTILKDWKGVTKSGKNWPYSEGNAIAALQMRDFRREITRHSDDFETYRANVEADAEKN